MFVACKSSTQDPAAATKAFYEALANKDYDKAKQLATTDSKTMLDLIKSMGEMGAEIKESKEDLEKIKTAVYTTDHVEGDKATVRVKFGSEENIVKLKKEEGAWKVALDKESLKETIGESTNESAEEIQEALKSAGKELENLDDSIASALKEAGAVLKSDSLKQAIEKAGEVLKKTGEALQEANKQ
jgi:hypothetical protein